MFDNNCIFAHIMVSITGQILQLPKILDQRGNLSFVENSVHISFGINRVFWVYDVPGGETRSRHAYKESEEFIIALSGSFSVILNVGIKESAFFLNKSYYDIYRPKLIWRKMEAFSTNILSLVLSSSKLIKKIIFGSLKGSFSISNKT